MTDRTSNKSDLQSLTCPHCNHTFQRYTNFWGTMCPKCQRRVPPAVEHPLVRRNRQKREELIRQVILSILGREGGDT